MMPCWFVYFDGFYDGQYPAEMTDKIREQTVRNRTDPNGWHECLVLNAVDGSIIHTDYGY